MIYAKNKLNRYIVIISLGADPKSIVCAFFKSGQCGKGDRCKFSHDLSIERKAEKRSLYVDMRDPGDTDDTMENWDETKLMEVVEKKHALANTVPTTTEIVSVFLLTYVPIDKNKLLYIYIYYFFIFINNF